MDYRLKTITFLTTGDELVYPFSMQAMGDVFTHCLKNSIEFAKLKNEHSNRKSKVQISKVKTDQPAQVPLLPVNEKKVFNNADWNQKNLLMFNGNLLPSCTAKNTHYLKALQTFRISSENAMMAALTSSGIIELYRYYFGSHQLFKLPIDLTELRQKHKVQLGDKKYITDYKTLVKAYDDVAFNNFEWCPVNFDDFKLLATTTKADELVIYRIQDEIALQEYSAVIKDLGKNELKWTFSDESGHNLFIGTEEGNLNQFQINLLSDGKVQSVIELEDSNGQLDIPITHMLVHYHQDSILLLCCKTHTLEIFQINKDEKPICVISKYIGLSITGLDESGELEFIMTTLNSNIYLLKLVVNSITDLIEIQEYAKIDFTSVPSDAETMPSSSKMSFYGVCTSKNSVLVYISCYPHYVSNFRLNYNITI